MKDSRSIELWPLERVRPYEHNPRHCPRAAVEKVAASIAEFGFRQPIIVDEKGEVIAGHTRLLAAGKLDLREVPVIVAGDLAPAQVKALRIADNRTAQETTWDFDLLSGELAGLLDLDHDLAPLGFDAGELDALLQPQTGRSDPDDLTELAVEPLSKPGDLWLLGRHRLLCGDATEAQDVARLMDGKRAALMATDPPYLVNYAGGTHPPTEGNGGKAGRAFERHWDTYVDPETSIDFYSAFLTCARQYALTQKPAIYQWFATARVELVLSAWRAAGLLPHQQLIWRKTRAVLTRSDFMWDYEPCLYGWVAGSRPARRPPADAKAVWEIASTIDDARQAVHPTIKPVETVTRPLSYHTLPGELLYEPFCGSGTALIAAEMTGRSCCALEISPQFCDVALARWRRFTGQETVRHA